MPPGNRGPRNPINHKPKSQPNTIYKEAENDHIITASAVCHVFDIATVMVRVYGEGVTTATTYLAPAYRDGTYDIESEDDVRNTNTWRRQLLRRKRIENPGRRWFGWEQKIIQAHPEYKSPDGLSDAAIASLQVMVPGRSARDIKENAKIWRLNDRHHKSPQEATIVWAELLEEAQIEDVYGAQVYDNEEEEGEGEQEEDNEDEEGEIITISR